MKGPDAGLGFVLGIMKAMVNFYYVMHLYEVDKNGRINMRRFIIPGGIPLFLIHLFAAQAFNFSLKYYVYCVHFSNNTFHLFPKRF